MTSAEAPTLSTLGEQLRIARTRARLDQQQVADQLGVSRPLISKWERDVSEPSVSEYKAFAQVCKAPWLLDLSGNIRCYPDTPVLEAIEGEGPLTLFPERSGRALELVDN